MSTDATLLRQRMMQVADEAITAANKWLASSPARIEEEHDPDVLLDVLHDLVCEWIARRSPDESEEERRLRLARLVGSLEARTQVFNRLTLAERSGVGIYDPDQRALKASVERTIRELRLSIALIVSADKEVARRERTVRGATR